MILTPHGVAALAAARSSFAERRGSRSRSTERATGSSSVFGRTCRCSAGSAEGSRLETCGSTEPPSPRAARLGRPLYLQGVIALASFGDDDAVDCALQRYVHDNAYRIAQPRDLLAALAPTFPNAETVLTGFGADFGR